MHAGICEGAPRRLGVLPRLKLILPEVIEYKDGNDGIQMPIILDLYYDNCDIAHVQIPVILGQDGQLKSTILPMIRIVDDKGNDIKMYHGLFSYWNELVLLIPSRSYVKLPLAGSHIAGIDKAGSYTMGISFLLEDNKGNMLKVEGHAKFIVKDVRPTITTHKPTKAQAMPSCQSRQK